MTVAKSQNSLNFMKLNNLFASDPDLSESSSDRDVLIETIKRNDYLIDFEENKIYYLISRDLTFNETTYYNKIMNFKK